MGEPQSKLIVVTGPTRRGPFFIGPGTDSLTIGRDERNPVVLPGERVAAVHCRLTQRDGRWFIEDLSGGEGTYVNGEPVSGLGEIRDVDRFQVGEFELQFLLEEYVPLKRTPPRSWPEAVVREPVAAQPPARSAPPPAQVSPPPVTPPPVRPPPVPPPAEPAQPAVPAPAPTAPVREAVLCDCGRALQPSPGGFYCPECQRHYDLKGRRKRVSREAVAAGADRGLSPEGAPPRRSKAVVAACVAGGVVVVVGLAVAAVFWFLARSPTPARSGRPRVDGGEGVPGAPSMVLPAQTSTLLDSLAEGAILRTMLLAAGSRKPGEASIKPRAELTMTMGLKTAKFTVLKPWSGEVAWKNQVPSLKESPTGLTLVAVDAFQLGKMHVPPGTILRRGDDAWRVEPPADRPGTQPAS